MCDHAAKISGIRGGGGKGGGGDFNYSMKTYRHVSQCLNSFVHCFGEMPDSSILGIYTYHNSRQFIKCFPCITHFTISFMFIIF